MIAETGAGQHGVATATAAALFGLGLHRLHGRGRRRAPGAQRVAHEAARRRGRAGAVGERDAEGRGERGDARVGRERREHALLPRLGDGSAPVPVDGARVPTRRRRRGPPAVPRAARRRRSRCRRRVRRRRLERDRHVRRLPRHRRAPRRRRSRRARSRDRVITARRSSAACPASCTACARCSCRTSTARCSKRRRSAPGSTIRASVPSTRCSRRPAGPSTTPRPTTRRSPASSCCRRPRASCPRSNPRTRSRGLHARPGNAIPAGSTVLVTLSGRGDKDAAQVAEMLGELE